MWKLHFVLPLIYPPGSNLKHFSTFKQFVPGFMEDPSHTAPLSVRAQILQSKLPLI